MAGVGVKSVITDTGEAVDLQAADGTSMHIPRYGVWQNNGWGGSKVVEVGDDLQALADKYGVSIDQVVRLGRASAGG